ncbi:c-type cytochrome [Chloroflexota bacterium]
MKAFKNSMTYRFLFPLLTIFLLITLLGCQSQPANNIDTPEITTSQGENIFNQSCASCHVQQGDFDPIGPLLDGIALTAKTRINGQDAQSYLRQSILQPSAYLVDGYNDLMPKSFVNSLSEEQLDAVIIYLLTLE